MRHARLIVFQLAEVAVSIDLFAGHPAALNPVASGSQLSVHEEFFNDMGQSYETSI